MTIYITQGRYTRDAITGMINKPEDRAKAVAALATAATVRASAPGTLSDAGLLIRHKRERRRS